MKKKKLEKWLKVNDAICKLMISAAALIESIADVINALNH